MFADFDGVMVNAAAVLNGQPAGSHRGGYLPWSIELTRHIVPGDNVLAMIVDARCLPVPPIAPGQGPESIDFLQPGGIYRDAALRLVPPVYLADVFARPADVLTSRRRVDVRCAIDAAGPVAAADVTVELLDGSRRLAVSARGPAPGRPHGHLRPPHRPRAGPPVVSRHPALHTVRVTVFAPGGTRHTLSRRIGFREAVFRADGFSLNGQPYKIFGLNRHQLFPYLGMAAPARLQRRGRRDHQERAQLQHGALLALPAVPALPGRLRRAGPDGLGRTARLGAAGRGRLAGSGPGDVHDMVVRDRSRPSVIVWATRLNETPTAPRLDARARQLAYDLDGSRPTTGAMIVHSTAGWAEDLFGFDDYHWRDGAAVLLPPLPGVPYLVSEAVGAIDGPPRLRWTDSAASLAVQAVQHAQVHSIARSQPRYAGLIAWAAVDYATMHHDGPRVWDHLKTAGVLDTFRVPKPGAAFYRSQADPAARVVILPVFFWDSGPGSAPGGPGPDAMIATNCDRLEIYAGGRHIATALPGRERFPGLAYPPAFVDLTRAAARWPALPGCPTCASTGISASRKAATVLMSADSARDRLEMTAEDTVIATDGRDATRVVFHAADAYGNIRPNVTGDVTLAITGPADLIGDNPFSFTAYGGVGGVFVRGRLARGRRSGHRQPPVARRRLRRADRHLRGRRPARALLTPASSPRDRRS